VRKRLALREPLLHCLPPGRFLPRQVPADLDQIIDIQGQLNPQERLVEGQPPIAVVGDTGGMVGRQRPPTVRLGGLQGFQNLTLYAP
jgi:hypothetical protein